MTTSLVDRLGGSTPEVDVYSEDGPYQAFGISRRAFGGEPLIDFVLRDGNHHALTYGHLYDIIFNPSKGIDLQFTDHVVQLRGRCLQDGYGQLLRQRVVWLREATDAHQRLAGPTDAVIIGISITPKREQLPRSLHLQH